MKTYEIIIETPKDSKEKYYFDLNTREISFKKALPVGMIFPHDFGFIPNTKGEDGDPLDALVISEFKTFPGCHIDCRLIGALTADQTEKNKTIRNDRFFFIPALSATFQSVTRIGDFPKQYIEELIFFFINYNQVAGKKFKPLKILPPSKAMKLIDAFLQ